MPAMALAAPYSAICVMSDLIDLPDPVQIQRLSLQTQARLAALASTLVEKLKQRRSSIFSPTRIAWAMMVPYSSTHATLS